MSIESVGIGIIGAGFLAETRARCYGRIAGKRAAIVGVVSRAPEKARDYASRHRVPRVFETLEDMLADDSVHLVDLCVPNHLHRPLAEEAARAGKHIVCTKPLTAYVGQDLGEGLSDEAVSACAPRQMFSLANEDARAMVEAARIHGVRLMYGENWVYAPPIVRARKLLQTSKGPILEMRGWECHKGSHSPYAKTWRYTGGGALLRLGAHPIGAMIHLKMQEGLTLQGRPVRPIAVTAEVADLTRHPSLNEENARIERGWKDVENWGCVIISFEDGARGIAYGSDNVLGGMQSCLQIFASNHHLECNLSPNDLLRAYAPSTEVFSDEYLMEKLDTTSGWSTPMPDEDWTSGHLAMCEDFVRAAAENRTAVSEGELGHDVVRVVYAAYVSAREGKRIAMGEL